MSDNYIRDNKSQLHERFLLALNTHKQLQFDTRTLKTDPTNYFIMSYHATIPRKTMIYFDISFGICK